MPSPTYITGPAFSVLNVQTGTLRFTPATFLIFPRSKRSFYFSFYLISFAGVYVLNGTATLRKSSSNYDEDAFAGIFVPVYFLSANHVSPFSVSISLCSRALHCFFL